MKIESIRIIGMHNVKDRTYNLNDMNYLFGHNGSGKSTVLQAIQLAVLGYIPGTDKTKSAIFAHANGNSMSVELHLDNGTRIIRQWYKTSKGIIEDFRTIPDGINPADYIGKLKIPIMDINAFLAMTANKMKDWFIDFLPDVDTSGIDWKGTLTAALPSFDKVLEPEYITECAAHADSLKGSTLECVRGMNTFFKESLSECKAEFGRVEHTVQSLIFYSNCTMDDPESVRERIAGEKRILKSLNDSLYSAEHNAEIKRNIEGLIAERDALGDETAIRDELTSLESEFVKRCNELETLKNMRYEYESAIKDNQAIIAGNGMCPYSKAKCESIVNQLDSAKNAVDMFSVSLIETEKQINKASADIMRLDSKITRLKGNLPRIQSLSNQIAYLESTIHTDALACDVDMLKTEIGVSEQHIADLEKKLAQIEANLKYDELTKNLTLQKYKLEQRIEMLKAWVKLTDVNGMQSDIMIAPFWSLRKNVSKYLSEFFEFDTIAQFNLEEKANSFSFGIIRDGAYIRYELLSSGEKCLFILALTLAMIEISDAQLKFILIDDILDHLDSKKIDACFETLYEISDVQIILAGVKDCNHPNASEFIINI